RRQVARQLTELAGPARRRHRDAPHVATDVEVGIVYPHRPVEAEWRLLQLPRELRAVADPVADLLDDVLEGQTVRPRLEDREAGDVVRAAGGLEGQEERVGSS